jgi:Ricin-type beta-trefoil lectin domain/Putative Ig domain
VKLKLALAAAAAAAAAAFPLAAVPALPALAAAHGPAGPPAPVVVKLHQAYEQALPRVRLGRIAGIVPPLSKKLGKKIAARAASGCAEPNCPLPYNGGPVQHTPHVYLLLWGPNWTLSDPSYADLYHLYSGLGVTSRDTWSTITSQYADGSGHPAFGSSVFAGAFQDTTAPPADVTPGDLAAEADGFASAHHIADLADAQVVIASQSGTCFNDGFVGSCGTPNPNAQYCAWHSDSTVPFTNLPYQLDAGADCGENWINAGSAGTYDGLSMTAGHEYAETITDPSPSSGWTDVADTISGGEIGDKCAWGGAIWGGHDPQGNVTLSTGTFAMQSLWSNSAGGCVMSTDRVSVTSPGSQSSTIGTGVSLQVHATSGAGAAISYRASGLPAGLSISAAGHIAGTPAVTAGTYVTKITATDSAGASGSASFTWYVRSRTGPVRGYGSKCADDHRSGTGNGNKIDIYACNGGAAQRLTFLADGEVTVLGRCLRDIGSRVVLYACNAAVTELWTRHSDGEYIVRYNGLCLTAPSAVNGTQLVLSGCTDSARQRWSLP